ncbi:MULTISPECIES: hypothetical protein [unclassified Clostridium]|uniref:hypothetical protein n=1 Tax=unclassified Clostridium TaxID=2614128 RepID=UPI0025C4D538|nr:MULTISPECIES: hypothetical protein [unclassified Clostridium]
MKEYIFNILFIFVIVFGVKDLISEFKKIKEHRVIITKGRVKINNDLLHGIVTTTWAIIFSVLFFITKVDVDMVVLKSNIMIICMGIRKLLTGIRNEIRDDGVYIRKEIYKWNQIETYRWDNEDKRGNSTIIFYISKYYDNFYDKEIKFKVNRNDKEELQSFFDEIGLKVSNMI